MYLDTATLFLGMSCGPACGRPCGPAFLCVTIHHLTVASGGHACQHWRVPVARRPDQVCVQDGTILLFDLRESHQSPQVISTAMAESNCVAFLDDIRLAAGGCSGKISLWDLRRMSLEEEIPAYMENGDSKWEGGQASLEGRRSGRFGRPAEPRKRKTQR